MCDGSDNDLDGSIDEGFDADGDGYATCANDCDDTNAAINPGASETCNAIDDNCDGNIDEGFDIDGDGYRTCDGDCNDLDAAVNPAAEEVCDDGIDNNCDGNTDVDEAFCGNVPTEPGTDVVVEPVDPVTGESPVSLNFDNITGGGTTSVTSSGTGTPPDSGFKLGNPPVYFEISTTAVFDGYVLVCIDYSSISF